MTVLYVSRGYTTHDHRFLTAFGGAFDTRFLPLEGDGGRYEQRPLPTGVTAVEDGPPCPLDTEAGVEDGRRRLERAVEAVRPNVIYAGPVPTAGALAADVLAGRAAPPALAVMSWGSDLLVDAATDPAAREAARRALSLADLFVCDCAAVRELAAGLASLPAVVQLPWGVEPERFGPGPSALRERLGWGDDVRVVLSLRSWEPIYDVPTVVEAFRQAHAAADGLRLLLLGDGSERPRVERLLRDADLGGVVADLGRVPQPDLPDVYRAADVYLSCALSDGSSVSLLEAMGTGLPTVVADIPSNREWAGRGGWLAPPGNAQAFAAAIREAAALSPAERKAVADGHRAVVAARADWSANVGALLRAVAAVGRTRRAGTGDAAVAGEPGRGHSPPRR